MSPVKPRIRVLVCGGRNFADNRLLSNTLNSLCNYYEITCIITGGAKGADTLALQWAKSRNIPTECYTADWAEYGKAAGPIRNAQMLDWGHPGMVVAFPGGRGTEDMCQKAKAAGLTVLSGSLIRTIAERSRMHGPEPKPQKSLRDHGIRVDEHRDGQQATHCPQCSHLRHKKGVRCLSVIRDSVGWKWNCHHCGWTGAIVVEPRHPRVGRTARAFGSDFGTVSRRQRYGLLPRTKQ